MASFPWHFQQTCFEKRAKKKYYFEHLTTQYTKEKAEELRDWLKWIVAAVWIWSYYFQHIEKKSLKVAQQKYIQGTWKYCCLRLKSLVKSVRYSTNLPIYKFTTLWHFMEWGPLHCFNLKVWITVESPQGLSEQFTHGTSLGSSDFPLSLHPFGKSDNSREFPRANFSRQPIRTFHCLYHTKKYN